MRDFHDAKIMAKGLRRCLAGRGLELTHSQSLEAIAQAFGYDNWNILAAKIEASRPAPAEHAAKGTLHCAFCGKPQQEVKLLIAGPGTAICNECVALCDDLVDDNEIDRRLREAPPGTDPAGALEPCLAGHSSEQLAAYLARAERRIADSEETIRLIDGADDAAMPAWMQAQAPAGRAKSRATLARQVAAWRRSREVAARLLEDRA
jgi:hypothetical protein